MKMKKLCALLLAAVMLLSLAACGTQSAQPAADPTAAPAAEPAAAPAPEETPAPAAAPAEQATPVPMIEHKGTVSAEDGNAQLNLILDALPTLRQDDSNGVWQYVVTDLDHNGRLELIAAKSHPEDRTTNMKLWEVNEAGTALVENSVKIDEEETFPEIMTENADTYYDSAKDTWNYMFYDHILYVGGSITVKVSVMLKDGEISYTPYACEVVENNVVTHIDANGQVISDADYNAAGANAFAGCMKGSTNFDWFTITEATSLARLADSYMMFTGERQPATAQTTPVPTATPAPTATPQPTPTYLMITKNPTNEAGKKVGSTALFVANANAFTGLSWTLVSPNGGEYTPAQFAQMYPGSTVSGENSTTLSIANVSFEMGGWGTYCTFYYNGQTARTNTAYLYVSLTPSPTPTPKPSSHTEGARLIDWSYSSITVGLDGGGTAYFDRYLCDISGQLAYGCPVELYYTGNEVTYIRVYGDEPEPDPVIYNSMSGTAYEAGGGFGIDLSNGSHVYIDSYKCDTLGTFFDGASCTVYFTGYTPSEANIYSVEIYGYVYTEPSPDYEIDDIDIAAALLDAILSGDFDDMMTDEDWEELMAD